MLCLGGKNWEKKNWEIREMLKCWRIEYNNRHDGVIYKLGTLKIFIRIGFVVCYIFPFSA
jgi:hypothetical protein